MTSDIRSDYSSFNENRTLSSKLFVRALISPREEWAGPVLRELDAIQNACKAFSDALGGHLYQNKHVKDCGLKGKGLSFKMSESQDKTEIEIKSKNHYISLTWSEPLDSWTYSDSNATLHEIYNIMTSIERN